MDYFNILNSIVEGVPWTDQSVRGSLLGAASCLEEDKWQELNNLFQQAVDETISVWGKADFRGRGAACGYEYFKRGPDSRVERLAIWKHPKCIAYICLELGDATRWRGVVCGERTEEELNRKS